MRAVESRGAIVCLESLFVSVATLADFGFANRDFVVLSKPFSETRDLSPGLVNFSRRDVSPYLANFTSLFREQQKPYPGLPYR